MDLSAGEIHSVTVFVFALFGSASVGIGANRLMATVTATESLLSGIFARKTL